MHHGRGEKTQTVFSRFQNVALFYDGRAFVRKKVFEHDGGFRGRDHGGIGIPLQNARKARAVIGFDVMHDQIIEFFSAERAFEIMQKFFRYGGVYRVEQHGFFVFQQIRIIGHPARHGKRALEQRDPPIACAEII